MLLAGIRDVFHVKEHQRGVLMSTEASSETHFRRVSGLQELDSSFVVEKNDLFLVCLWLFGSNALKAAPQVMSHRQQAETQKALTPASSSLLLESVQRVHESPTSSLTSGSWELNQRNSISFWKQINSRSSKHDWAQKYPFYSSNNEKNLFME